MVREDYRLPDKAEHEKRREDMLQYIKEMHRNIEQLRELVWGYDIPSPTIPEYREHHESIQKILAFIDNKLLKED